MINLRDNGIYCRGPIYLRNRYFEYYLDKDTILRFDASELFYYTHHSIQRRGGHLFVADYGSQLNVYARYGIKSFAVCISIIGEQVFPEGVCRNLLGVGRNFRHLLIFEGCVRLDGTDNLGADGIVVVIGAVDDGHALR